MPRVIVGAAQVPFERGGAEWHVDALVQELRARNFETEVVALPFQWGPREEALKSASAWRLIDVIRPGGREVDLFIGTKFPTYVAAHPNKVVWLFHPFRQAYDLHESGVDGFADTPRGRETLAAVRDLDRRAFAECRAVFTTSENNAARLRRFGVAEASILRLPLRNQHAYRCAGFEPFVLSVGRLETLKRTDLLVRGAAFMSSEMRVVIVGEGRERGNLEASARANAGGARVEFRGRVSDEVLRGLYATAGCVFYGPLDEDYGLVTLEAFHSGKPVVTAHDSGGVLEFVRDQKNGLVVSPNPEAIGGAARTLLGDPALAKRLGDDGRASLTDLDWEVVIRTLTRTIV
jgi:glycosyltransferase involved in cell wall biosynthesis